MKKIISFVLIITMLVLLCSCMQNTDLDNINFNSVNYNNLYWSNGVFCGNGNAVFYNSDGFYNQRIFVYNNGHKIKLLENLDFAQESFYGDFFVVDDFIYFVTYSESNDQYHFYKYILSNRTYEELFTIDNLAFWMATAEYVAFSKFRDHEEEPLRQLYIYDIAKETETLICEGIREFGIVDNKIRYLAPVDWTSLTVYEYDLLSKETQNSGNISIRRNHDYLMYNFTTEYTVICSYAESNWFAVYTKDGMLFEYRLPKAIQQFIAGDKFAYAVCFKREEYSSTAIKDEENGIYKIDLSTGSYEKIYDADDDTQINVCSDNQIYIMQGKMYAIGLYRTTAYLLDTSDLSKKELFIY